jgi:hypothetical protein
MEWNGMDWGRRRNQKQPRVELSVSEGERKN